MRTHLYLLLLAVGASAAPLWSDLAELHTWLQQIYLSVDTLNLRIETPVSIDDENCIKTLFEGMQLLKNNSKMGRFRAFFQAFDRLRPILTANPAREGECNTERKNAKKFIEKLRTFIRKFSAGVRV